MVFSVCRPGARRTGPEIPDQAWGRALKALGMRDQAREKYTEAARMDLSAADRAEVVRRLEALRRGS